MAKNSCIVENTIDLAWQKIARAEWESYKAKSKNHHKGRHNGF